MSTNLRLPNITGGTPQEQIRQMNSFLYQTIEQLNHVIGTMEKDSASIVEQIRDTSAATDTPEKAEATFNSIKALIIKSADIVEAYNEEIKKRFEGEYFADSDFGTYLKETAADITANSDKITQKYEEIEKIISPLLDEEEAIRSLTGTIKTGKITSNGETRIGIEIGEKITEGGVETFNAFAQFTPDRLAFFNANSPYPVAYISDYKLFITNVEISGNLKLGGYLYDTSNGIAHKWVGRS